jgi:hypothetical protein
MQLTFVLLFTLALKDSEDDLRIIRSLADPKKYGPVLGHENNARMFERLKQYRCGAVQKPAVKFLQVLPPYTWDMLKRHDNPTFGCYTVIDGFVYDLRSEPPLSSKQGVQLLT